MVHFPQVSETSADGADTFPVVIEEGTEGVRFQTFQGYVHHGVVVHHGDCTGVVHNLEALEPCVPSVLQVEEGFHHGEVEGPANSPGSGEEYGPGTVVDHAGYQSGLVDVVVSSFADGPEVVDAYREFRCIHIHVG